MRIKTLIRALLLTTLGLAQLTVTVSAQGQDDEKLEEWQKRVLESIEASKGNSRDKRQGYSRDRNEDQGASRAAQEARQRHGGEVLAVVKASNGYRVRLLLEDGRVITVSIKD